MDRDTFAPATMLRHGGDGDPDGDGAYTKPPGPHQGTVYVVAGNGTAEEKARNRRIELTLRDGGP